MNTIEIPNASERVIMTTKIQFSKYVKLDVNGRLYLGSRLPEIRKAWANLSPREREAEKILALIREIDEVEAAQKDLSQLKTK